MASYQELETRMNVLSDMLQFVMTTCRMQGVVQGPGQVLGPNGQPIAKDGSLLDWYKLIKQSGFEPVLQSEEILDAVVEDRVNG